MTPPPRIGAKASITATTDFHRATDLIAALRRARLTGLIVDSDDVFGRLRRVEPRRDPLSEARAATRMDLTNSGQVRLTSQDGRVSFWS